MLKVAKEKLKKNNGESLAEVMITVLIIAVGLALLASLIMAAGHMMDRGQKTMDEIYAGTNSIEAVGEAIVGSEKSAEISSGVLSLESLGDVNGMASINIKIYRDKDSGLKAYYRNNDSLQP